MEAASGLISRDLIRALGDETLSPCGSENWLARCDQTPAQLDIKHQLDNELSAIIENILEVCDACFRSPPGLPPEIGFSLGLN